MSDRFKFGFNSQSKAKPFTVDPNFDLKSSMRSMLQLSPIVGAPYNAEDVYYGIKEGDYIKAGLGGLGLLGFGGIIAPPAASGYARATMPLRNTQVNIEATSPNMLQMADDTPLGRNLSDIRYNAALENARSKGMPMADAPVTKTQGVWVDPVSKTEEFNRVYSQNVGRLSGSPIQENQALQSYAESMGGDLGQWGVGAGRFSPIPFNLNKDAANAVLYPKVSSSDIIEAGRKVNPLGGVVSGTPQGGMMVFDPDNILPARELAKALTGISTKPKYGKLDSALFFTDQVKQNANMKGIDKLIRNLGY